MIARTVRPAPALVIERSMATAIAGLAAAILLLTSCRHTGATVGAAAGTSPAAVAPDSMVGIVAVIGTSFEKHLVIRTGSVITTLAPTVADSAALTRLAGVEVAVHGRAQAGAFRVTSFVARRVDGAPVADGVMRRDGDRYVLDTALGRLPLGNAPAALRTMIGARVWIGGPLGTGPNTYGVIVPVP